MIYQLVTRSRQNWRRFKHEMANLSVNHHDSSLAPWTQKLLCLSPRVDMTIQALDTTRVSTPAHYLIASDFDQTLSFNDSGAVLSEILGASNFHEKVRGLAESNLVQQGGELAYLIRHDPEFRGVRREHLEETGRRVRLRHDIPALVELLERGIEGNT